MSVFAGMASGGAAESAPSVARALGPAAAGLGRRRLRSVVARRNQILAAIGLAAVLFGTFAAVALWRSIEHDEYEKTDSRLVAELAGAVRVVERLGRDARAAAVRLAADPEVQRALADRDEARLRAIAAEQPGVGFEADGRPIAGRARDGGLFFPAAVVAGGDEIGHVVVEVPVEAIAARTALAPGDRLVAGDAGASSSPATVRIDGGRYRAVSTSGGPARLTALAPHGPIADAIRERRRRLLFAVLASFASVALIASLVFWVGRPAKRLRRSVEEPPLARGGRRSRQAATLVGNVLAAGHDVDALLPVILESAMAVTGAASARLVTDGEELARAGATDAGEPPLTITLSSDSGSGGQLVLYPPRGGAFDDEAVQLANWFGGRASIALQNAHLHRLARRLALTDDLTQLANRRQFDEALGAEVVRAERFDDPVAVVVADLDNFKDVNDRFGHDAGDLVLCAFADAIRATVRDVDLPARYGGEEFTVLLPATDADGGRQLAERLRIAAEELEIDVGAEAPVRARSSFGVASFPEQPSAAALMRAADRALYQAKAAGKNRVVVAGETVGSLW